MSESSFICVFLFGSFPMIASLLMLSFGGRNEEKINRETEKEEGLCSISLTGCSPLPPAVS